MEDHVETARLLKLDEELRRQADDVLRRSGLGEILQLEGYHAVGSYVMRVMTWRDLDFERITETPDWKRHWELGSKLAASDWIWKCSCFHAYRDPRGTDQGLYWGLWLRDPAGGPVWKMDLWTARAEEFAVGSPHRDRWASLLTEETRVAILAIKEAVCERPEYGHELFSVHIYEAVLDHGVRGVEAFERWWRGR